MLRIHSIANAAHAVSYYGKSDAGYFLNAKTNRREWGGKATAMLELAGDPGFVACERQSAALFKELTISAVEGSISWALPADIEAEALTGLTVQGMLRIISESRLKYADMTGMLNASA
jgi:hypothetical protein